jgi:hypothetical protein
MPIAIGSSLVSVKLHSTSSSAQSNVPITFGHIFKEGDLPAAGAAVQLRAADSSIIPCQLDVRVRYADESVLHAVLSCILPSLAANSANVFQIVRAAPGAAATPAVPGDFPGLNSLASITENGSTYTVSLASLLAAPIKTWLSGDVVSEWEYAAPLKTSGNAEHPDLHARFCVRAYKGQGKARVDVTIENTWAWNPSPRDVPYNFLLNVGANQVYSQSGLVHFPRARHRHIGWWNGTEPAVHIEYDIAYLIATKAIPNYNLGVVPSQTRIQSNYDTFMANSGPMGTGIALKGMPQGGGRQDIGLFPGWTALYLISQDAKAKQVAIGQGTQAGTWPMHYRDKNTGRVLLLTEWPYFTTTGNLGDTINPATNQPEKAPNIVSNSFTGSPDVSHHPEQATIPYILTGDVYHLEELHFWAMYCVITQGSHPSWRNGAQALLKEEQLRGQAWGLRTLGHAAHITPQDMRESAEFKRILQSNLDWYNTRYSNNPAETLGIIHHGPYSLNYTMEEGKGVTGMSNWQHDHFTATLGHLIDLGFESARPLFNYMAKYTVGRLYGIAGTCWIQAAAYTIRVRDDQASPIYSTYLECYQKTMSPAVLAAAQESNCGTQAMADAWLGQTAWSVANNRQRSYTADGVSNPYVGDMDGYSDGDTGYPACLQQSISYAVTYGIQNAANAWEVFEGRTVKPTYSAEPQMALLPRTQEAIPVAAPPDNYTIGSGLAMYFGQSAASSGIVNPNITPFAEDFTATPTEIPGSGDPWGWDGYQNRPVVFDMHGSGGFNYTTGMQYRMPVSGRMAYEDHTEMAYSVVAQGDDTIGRWVSVRPVDRYGVYPNGGQHRESFFAGFSGMGTPDVSLIGVRRDDALMRWALSKLPVRFDLSGMAAMGGSMGAGGCFTWAIKRPQWFGSVYSDRGRWRNTRGSGVILPQWTNGLSSPQASEVPNIAPEDGGGKFADWQNGILHISNLAHKLPWIGVSFAKQDNDYPVSDHVEAIAALRARKSGHCIVWNNGGHSSGPGMLPIISSYPFGLFKVGKSYPYFFEHSLDKDPMVDDEGGINLGLTFRNVVDTAGTWSCEIKHISTACTVKVEPCNPVNFPAGAAAQLIPLPANTWVAVTFNA